MTSTNNNTGNARITLSRFNETIFSVERQKLLHISVCMRACANACMCVCVRERGRGVGARAHACARVALII